MIPTLQLGAMGRRYKQATGFDPATLFAGGQAGFWLDPSDLSTVFQDDAGTVAGAVDAVVGRINDKSGRGNHFVQATAGAKPTLRLVGGRYKLEFAGAQFLRRTMAAAIAQPFSQHVGASITGANAQQRIVDSDTARALIGRQSATEMALFAGVVLPFARAFATPALVMDGIFNGASSSYRENGAAKVTGDAGANGYGATATIGALASATSAGAEFLTGDVWQVIVRAGAPTTQELSDIVAHNNLKTGAF